LKDKVLIVGADSTIGRWLSFHLRESGFAVVETTRRKESITASRFFLDLSDSSTFPLLAEQPRAVIIAGAVTKLKECSDDPTRTFQVNVAGPVEFIRRTASPGTLTVFLSSNLVYDDKTSKPEPELPVSPVTEYGRQKAEAEKRLQGLKLEVSIVRLTKVVDPTRSLLARWRTDLTHHRRIQAFQDLFFCPVSLNFVGKAIVDIVRERREGIFHLTGLKDLTYADAAEQLASRIGISTDSVERVFARGALDTLIQTRTALGIDMRMREAGFREQTYAEVLDDLMAEDLS
jgi:dTDP-4-dehydrorhamnose reductase